MKSVLHHVGIVVSSITETAPLFERLLGLDLISDIVVDEVQKVKVAFVDSGSAVPLELIEPLTIDSPVTKFLKNGGGLHHLCYEVDNIEQAVGDLRRQGAIVVCPPVPAAAFSDKKIAFLYMQNKSLIELVEKGNDE